MADLNFSIYDTDTLLGVFRDKEAMEPVHTYWLDLCFPQVVAFDDEYVDFSKLTGVRKLAPFVSPLAEGRPIMSRGENLTRVKPAYIKELDAVSASRVLRKWAGMGELGVGMKTLTPQQRYNAAIVDIANEHNKAIRRRWEWMAAEAIMNGAVTMEGEDYPKTLVDYGRDAAHTVTLGAGARWGDAGVDILKSIEDMAAIVFQAKGGGAVNRITIGAKAWDAMRRDPDVREEMNLRYKDRQNNGLNIKTGILEPAEVQYVGTVSNNIDVYVYRDYYHDADGNAVPIMDERDVIFTSPSVQGVRCFGAIHDKRAGWRPLPIFPKMWDQENPSATMFLTQSAPLPVPVNPNATLRARVVA